ncbi:Hydrogenase maturation protein, carbamoyl dehydratase HypE [Desulfotomaculum arcticum]|uniref:Hydrogenase maturation protein, carbamoyl dehydratase HypE n=1 Tax=Desulfotruncus arcticus DSM 17038 TaxID=1121424 RepID=A0A1I2TW79_9FIRM|nr:hydrogenase expression/formation protein HypE [Desulfotruncus arcticus]SFG69138.1 Hydrogenase maturation protein, carbamoyl dehydratase HypE [Desulfotomaculum arcticum] [Desulfotruncus arcticus DSM 17038]
MTCGINNSRVLLAHGDGGLLSREMVRDIFLKYFNNPLLGQLSDAAVFRLKGEKVATTIDAFVVDPVFFPGGDIGKLAVCGTVNDLAVSGARPVYLNASFIIEEGLLLTDLEKIAAAMAEACVEAGVAIVAGDTKVVPRGHADKIFITTSGVGIVPDGLDLGYHRPEPGDVVIVNGSMGNHGLTVLTAREALGLEGALKSDCAPLNHTIFHLLSGCPGVKLMRDLTRGGLASAAKEIAESCGMDMLIKETAVPVDREVRGAAEMLGLDPFYLANEGKFLAVVTAGEADKALELLHESIYGRDAVIIGEVRAGRGSVYLQTALGGTKFLDLLAGAPLPRIC